MVKLVCISLLFILMQFHVIGQNMLLWEISGKNLKKPAYLYGTFHGNDRRLFNFSDSVYVAIDQSDLIVLESDVFSLFSEVYSLQEKVVMKYDNSGTPYTSSDRASKTLYGDEDGYPQFLDAWFQQYCYNANKNFAALEGSSELSGLLTSDKLPELSKLRLDKLLTTREDLVNAYTEGDIYKLDDLLRINLAAYPGLYEKLIIDRNQVMAARLDSIFQKKSAFCAIGAGHLPGHKGLIMQLRMRGYRVRMVETVYLAKNSLVKEKVKSFNSYNYHNKDLLLGAVFPGKPKETLNGGDGTVLKLIYQDFGQGNMYSVEVFENIDLLSIETIASLYIPSPLESPAKRVLMDNGSVAYEGIADAYPEGVFWVRVISVDEYFAVIKTYGGNKYMSSRRPLKFFENVWFE